LFGKVVYLTTQKEKVKKKTKKINPRHRRVFNRLPEGEEWALKVIFHPNKLKGDQVSTKMYYLIVLAKDA
jgi:hypothetical protein